MLAVCVYQGYFGGLLKHAMIAAVIGGIVFTFLAYVLRGDVAGAPFGLRVAGSLFNFLQVVLYSLLAFWTGRQWAKSLKWWRKAGAFAAAFGFMLANNVLVPPTVPVGQLIGMFLMMWVIAAAAIFLVIALGFGVRAIFHWRERAP